jgi:hypothetical protein
VMASSQLTWSKGVIIAQFPRAHHSPTSRVLLFHKIFDVVVVLIWTQVSLSPRAHLKKECFVVEVVIEAQISRVHSLKKIFYIFSWSKGF